MVKQYPHTISITTTAAATKTNGNWTTGGESTSDRTGRYEPNSGNEFVTTADGQRIAYDGIVYMPLPQADIAPGSKVVVKNGATVLSQGTVKKFSRGQQNARLWL